LESELLPYQAHARLSAQRVLVIAPHPDDEIFGCGGAIALHRQAGIPVSVAILTGGEIFGDPGVRLQESLAAATFVGSPNVECWGLPDRSLVCSEALVQRMAAYIEALDVDLIYAPSPWEIHPDHRQASWLAIESIRRVGYTARLAFYEVGAPLRPNVLLDITPVQTAKTMAMKAFTSQQELQDFCGQIQALNKYRTYSLPRSVEAVEAFWLLEPTQLSQLASSGVWAHVSPGLTTSVDRPVDLPLVSVMIRSVGRDSLYQALDSVALQTYPNIEVVVVAATALHPQLPSRCGPHPIRLITTEQQLPRSRAANVALDHARGEFALFLDDDDWLMPSHIARLAEVLQGQPMAKAVYTGVSTVDAGGSPIGQVFDIPFDATRLRVQNLMPIHAVLFRFALVRDACRFDEGLDLYEDWDFWVQVSKLAPMVHLPGVSAVYRIHESSGVHDADGPAQAAAGALYSRWHSEITPDELSGLVSRVQETDALRHRVAKLEAEVLTLRSRVVHNQNVIGSMSSSLSWRVTAPLRRLSWLTGLGLLLRVILCKLLRVRAVKRAEGWKGISRRVSRRLGFASLGGGFTYTDWLANNEMHGNSGYQSALKCWLNERVHLPLVSVVVPVYNPDSEFLRAAIESVLGQVYERWELILVDDASTDAGVSKVLAEYAKRDDRICVVRRDCNGHISAATNSGIDSAQGEILALLDHDDLLSPDALFWVAREFLLYPETLVAYSDEDKVDAHGRRSDPYFKPDWNPDLLRSQNYFCHLSAYRMQAVKDCGSMRIGFEGSQDHDLALRVTDLALPGQIRHIPRVLYHWRIHEGSTAGDSAVKPYTSSASVRAIKDHLRRRGLGGRVESLPEGYRVRLDLPALPPLVSIVIPTRNQFSLLHTCVESILSKTTYSRFEIIVIDNGSDDERTLAYLEELSVRANCTVLRDPGPFNFSALNNRAVHACRGEVVALVNNDIEVISPGWLEEMTSHALREDVGAVGARLWYPDDTLQHAGVLLIGGVAGHAHPRLSRGDLGYFKRASLLQNFSAVTAACLVIEKRKYLKIGGLDEGLMVAFNDVDFCLRLLKQGLYNVWTPYAELYHHESATRGYETTPEKRARFEGEIRFMQERWGSLLTEDPCYNPNLSLDSGFFELAEISRVQHLP